jgi:hypothetical protein
MKYLYYFGHYNQNVFRVAVTRETDSNIWYKGIAEEKKLSKKTYREGSGWDAIHYYEETPELLERYNSKQLMLKFKKKLKELENITDKEVIKKVLKIELKL